VLACHDRPGRVPQGARVATGLIEDDEQVAGVDALEGGRVRVAGLPAERDPRCVIAGSRRESLCPATGGAGLVPGHGRG
jgi:hypothetical protein